MEQQRASSVGGRPALVWVKPSREVCFSLSQWEGALGRVEGEDPQRNCSLHSYPWLGRQMVHVKTTAVIAEQRHPLCACVRVRARVHSRRGAEVCYLWVGGNSVDIIKPLNGKLYKFSLGVVFSFHTDDTSVLRNFCDICSSTFHTFECQLLRSPLAVIVVWG